MLGWTKPVLHSHTSESDLPVDHPDQPPSKKCFHSLYKQKHLKTNQWSDSSFQMKHLEFINMYHFTVFHRIHLDV